MDLDTEKKLFQQQFNLHYGIEEKSFIKDLNIYEEFCSIDLTKTIIGSQYLYQSIYFQNDNNRQVYA